MPKRRSNSRVVIAKSGGANINTFVSAIVGVLTTVLAGIIMLMIGSVMSKARDQTNLITSHGTTLTEIKTTLPMMDKSIAAVQQDVKEARANMVTRSELDNKHKALQDAIKEVKTDVKGVDEKQDKLQQEVAALPKR